MGATSGDVAVGPRYGILSSWINRRLRPYILFPFLGLMALVLAYPIFMVVYGSFKGGPPGTDAPFTVDGYVRAWTHWRTYKALIVTFGLAVPRVLLGATFSIIVTWVITRTNTPWRGLFERLIWFKLFLPGLPVLVAWLLIAGGKMGLVNVFLMDVFHLSSPPLDIRSFWGVIFLALMTSTATFFMYLAPGFRNMDASLEESSRVSGASSLTTLFRITVPVLMPAITGVTLLIFLFALASYETELFLLSGRGVYVFTTLIWWNLAQYPVDYPGAMAVANAFLVFTAIVILLQFRILGGRQYTTITGRGFTVRPIDLGRWRWVTFGLVMSWVLVGLVLPLVVLIWGTLQRTYAVADSPLTLMWWRKAFEEDTLPNSFKNTMILGLLAATGGTVLYTIMSYVGLRTKLKGREWITALSWVPRMAPGIIAAVGILWAVLGGIPGIKFLYGTLALMAIVIVLERTPQGMRMLEGGMVQLSAELEEAARSSGASWFQTMRRVVLPLLAPTLLNEWLLCFLGATRALVILLFIYKPGTKTMSLEIFNMMTASDMQPAAVLGVVLTAVTMVVATLAAFVAGRQRRMLEGRA